MLASAELESQKSFYILRIDRGKCRLNDITAETYRWNEKTRGWDITEAQ